MAELQEGYDPEVRYYKGAGKEALDEWRAMSQEERDKLKKGDDIDEINTTDLEQPEDQAEFPEVSYEYLIRNRINLARAFLGEDGGLTVRKLKKYLKNERQAMQDEKDDSKKRYDRKQAAKRAEEAGEEEAAAEGEDAVRVADQYSDESDVEGIVDKIDDESWAKIVEDLELQQFSTEEEAKAYFDSKLKDWSRMRVKKRKVNAVDERE